MPTPTSWSSVAYITPSYVQNIDALLGSYRWASSTVTYSFPGYDSLWSTDTETGYGASTGDGEPWSLTLDILSYSDKAYFSEALSKWSAVANLNFVLVDDTATSVGDIRAGYSSISPGAQAHAYYPRPSASAGDVWFNVNGTSASSYWIEGSNENFTIIHELGHALGLKHPFEAGDINAILSTATDTQSYTVMSYSVQAGGENTAFSFNPTTPMILDIQAIQYIYGANDLFHAGDDT